VQILQALGGPRGYELVVDRSLCPSSICTTRKSARDEQMRGKACRNVCGERAVRILPGSRCNLNDAQSSAESFPRPAARDRHIMGAADQQGRTARPADSAATRRSPSPPAYQPLLAALTGHAITP